ncbi:MAG: polysaccharide deacetylase family protein [Heliobacteriaceae bacterium]|nr:polysaccharide deacetylase family protein [Heliobacteriaceae bacterium]MDD4586945.1 polysaccharide deacetylase family protein [Heliobacteriaceae bacterium]
MKMVCISRRILQKGVFLGLLLCLLGGIFWALEQKVPEPALMTQKEQSPPEPGVIRQGPAEPKIALTVNVDWGEAYLPQMLAILEQNNAKATFFFTGRFAEKFPEYVKRVVAAGHEAGNHGYSHPHPCQISGEANRREIRQTHQVLENLTGTGSRWFAPPYGEHDDQLVKIAAQEGYGTILWTVDSADWLNPSPMVWMQRVTKGIGPGALILVHPTPSTIQALPQLLKYCQEKGWSAVTVSELLANYKN